MSATEDEVLALAAVLRGHLIDAATILRKMTPLQLHELIGACLLMAGMARDTILDPTSDAPVGSNDWITQIAHQALDALGAEGDSVPDQP